MTDREAEEYILSLKQYGSVPGLANITELCRRLGNPQDELSFVHIAGTNGKGSVLAFVSTILRHAGYRVGRFLSPTIFTYRERIQVNGRPITKKVLCFWLETIRAVIDEMTGEGLPHPTLFEVETAMAFCYFREKQCGIVVLETGMGGLLDATNVVRNTKAAVFSSIGRDHMAVLGDSLERIAENKAGIIKNGCYVITSAQKTEVAGVLGEKAKIKGCPLVTADVSQAKKVRYGLEHQYFDYGGYERLEITLAGRWQIDNAVLAVETIKALCGAGFSVTETQLRRGLKEAEWPGRFQVLDRNPWFIADGAHNEDAARRLADSLRFYFTNRRIIYIIGVLRDKEVDSILRETCPLAEQIFTVTPPIRERAMTAYELALEVKRVFSGGITAADSLEEAVELSRLMADKNTVIVAFGSLSFLGDLIAVVDRGRRL